MCLSVVTILTKSKGCHWCQSFSVLHIISVIAAYVDIQYVNTLLFKESVHLN